MENGNTATVAPQRAAREQLRDLPDVEELDFGLRFRHECVVGSAVDTALYDSAVVIIDDSGMWEPNRALNQEVRTQYQTRRPHSYGAIGMFVNEDGSYWQGKPESPKTGKKGKSIKYETPVGNGSRAFLPKVPLSVRRKIAQRYGINDPNFAPNRAARRRGILMVPFWTWVEKHPEIPIIITEGGKKSLSILSLGFVAIGLYGVNGGYNVQDKLKNPIPAKLVDDIARFVVPGRMTKLAFDQDGAADVRRRVSKSLEKFGGLLSKAGSAIEIIEWDEIDCKGADDFIMARGAEAWNAIEAAAMPFVHWRILQRLKNTLRTTPSLQTNSRDISTIDLSIVPAQGVIGIVSAKGTGKTKAIGKLVEGVEKVLSAGHRIALQRNLSARLGLNYIGDIGRSGRGFVSGGAYALRLGSCVDSLISIAIEAFAGCDLVVDEVTQVLRHLITSSTCAKDGKRPVLLARFKAVVQAARRVIIADADLDDASLHYIQELRGDGGTPFLLRNDFKSDGYDCRFISCPDKSAITSELLADVGALPSGKTLLVAVADKGKHLADLIQRQYTDTKILLINSDTSSKLAQKETIENLDAVLMRHEYDVIIASPSMGTGVSAEAHGIISKVYGIFGGTSIIDKDMSQALSRVREPVPRVVWVDERGSNFSAAGTSTNPLELKNNLRESTAATIALTRSSLREDCIGAVDGYDWQSDPNLNLWAKIEADRNRSMWQLRDSLLILLRSEGNRIEVVTAEKNNSIREMLSVIREQRILMDAEGVQAASILRFSDVLFLENKETKLPEEMQALERFYLCDFYGIPHESLTVDHVLADKEGRRRGEILSLEAQLYPDLAVGRSVRRLEGQKKWNQGLCPWDLSNAPLRQKIRQHFGLDGYLDTEREWTATNLEDLKQQLLQHVKPVKNLLNLTVREEMSGAQMLGTMLSQLGLKTANRMASRSASPGGKRSRIYRIDTESWAESMEILERRRLQRAELERRIEAVAAESWAESMEILERHQNRRAELGAISGVPNMMDEDLIRDCVDMATVAAETDDDTAIAEILGCLSEALREHPESKREIWARLSLEHQTRLRRVPA
jgi:hypothetical protein